MGIKSSSTMYRNGISVLSCLLIRISGKSAYLISASGTGTGNGPVLAIKALVLKPLEGFFSFFFPRFTFLLDNRSCYSDSSICCHLHRSQPTTMETLVSQLRCAILTQSAWPSAVPTLFVSGIFEEFNPTTRGVVSCFPLTNQFLHENVSYTYLRKKEKKKKKLWVNESMIRERMSEPSIPPNKKTSNCDSSSGLSSVRAAGSSKQMRSFVFS